MTLTLLATLKMLNRVVTMRLLIVKLAVILMRAENAEGFRKVSRDNAALVRPAVQQICHQPDDVCCMVTSLHFFAVL